MRLALARQWCINYRPSTRTVKAGRRIVQVIFHYLFKLEARSKRNFVLKKINFASRCFIFSNFLEKRVEIESAIKFPWLIHSPQL